MFSVSTCVSHFSHPGYEDGSVLLLIFVVLFYFFSIPVNGIYGFIVCPHSRPLGRAALPFWHPIMMLQNGQGFLGCAKNSSIHRIANKAVHQCDVQQML